MNTIKEAFHGSDLETIAARYQIDQNSIIPYGANVNPLGISPKARQALLENIDAIKSYPDRDYFLLRSSIAKYCNTAPETIILGNGTSDLIKLTIDLLAPTKTMILGPTYSEYARTATLASSEIVNYTLKDGNDFELDLYDFFNALDESIELLVLCNPNNPTSKLINHDTMQQILDKCYSLGIFVLVDETYIEFVENSPLFSAITLTKEYENLIVLRSVSKFFAAPGIRLGYAITSNTDFLKATSNETIPWNINTYASVAHVMFEDEHYINLTKSLMQTERNLIYSALTSRKTIKVFKPSANFVLIKLLRDDITSADVFEHCIQKGYMIRDCSDFPGLSNKFIRFCFMKPEQNDNIVNRILEIV